MINYFNFKKFDDQFLITNDFGSYAFIDSQTLRYLILGDKEISQETKAVLTEKRFLTENSPRSFAENMYEDMRSSKSYLFQATGLHIFVMTNQCNQACVYCQASASSQKRNFMSAETAEYAVRTALSSANPNLSFEFQGGEPLLNFDTIRHIIEYTESIKEDKNISYSVVTNLTMITDEMIRFFVDHHVNISTSLDGPKELHDRNRPLSSGGSSYDKAVASIKHLQDRGIGVGAIQTTTKYSLDYAESIVEEYIKLGLGNLFIRPLTPLGAAGKIWSRIGYTAEEFISFYEKVLKYVIEMNQKGHHIQENHAAIFLSKILHGYGLNYMELRSPCGAGFGQMAYYPDGEIFTCDEGRMLHEMGDDSFRIGNVFSGKNAQLMDNPACIACARASCLESIPGCSDCVYQPYCGICPVINLALYGDIIHRQPNNWRCRIYSGMLETIFRILKQEDQNITNILCSWKA